MRSGILSLAAACFAVGACEEVDSSRWLERQAAVDPPTLWRVEAIGTDARPVQICVDRGLRDGFRRALPEVDGQMCEPTDDPVLTPNGQIQRCRLGGLNWMVRTDVTGGGDQFTVDYRAEILNTRPPQVFSQQRRYTHLGPCPDGWRIGDNTDQQGRKRNDVWTPAW